MLVKPQKACIYQAPFRVEEAGYQQAEKKGRTGAIVIFSSPLEKPSSSMFMRTFLYENDF
jgi:hypothetical protein